MNMKYASRLTVCYLGLFIPGTPVTFAEDDTNISAETIVVTGTREARPISETAESVSVLTAEEIAEIAPSHPSELLNRVPGVHINNLGGEGHMSSIRQPLTTSAVYLFLEDGIPTRPSGFFNHNGLYEINIPQSSRIEVIKGPGSALYGSDAIGGIINAITQPAPEQTEYRLNTEVGSHGWTRGLLSGGTRLDNGMGIRADVNYTQSSGYRDESDYDRISTNFRLDGKTDVLGNVKTIASFTKVNQSGASSLEEADYRNNPEKNRYHGDIGFREVDAFRLSSEFSREIDTYSLLTLTPYYRHNAMTMMPSWMITYDPNVREYDFQSYGLMSKYRRNFWDDKGILIVGIDVDYTPADYQEDVITVTQSDDIYIDYTLTGVKNYDFTVDQKSISPYVHTEYFIAPQWLMTAGVRYDNFDVDYQDNLTNQAVDPTHLRPESQTLSYDQWSPKWSLIYQYNDKHHTYLNYRASFVAPSVGSLFRPGSAIDSTELKPITVDSFEWGFRGNFHDKLDYEIAIYSMKKNDDIVSFIDGEDRKVTNAGETQHEGIEVGLDFMASEEWQVALAWTRTHQTYESYSYVFQCFSPVCGANGRPIIETRDFAGFDIGIAPETLGNLTLVYTPKYWQALQLEVEWEHVGAYFTDETNTQSYDGHELVNLRVNYDVSPSTRLMIRVTNLADEKYSTYTSNQVGDPDISYRPGLPRSFFAGVTFDF
ncbi:MAG: TonB-dependent receptor [Pseudomonadota bacterium]